MPSQPSHLALLFLSLSACATPPSAGPAAPATAPAAPASAAALVDKVVAAYGGAAALDSVRALRMTGTVASATRGTGELVRSLERPDRLRVEVRYPASRELRLLDGAKAFQNGKPVGGLAADAMALQAYRLDLAGLLGRQREKVRDLGPSQRDGVQLLTLGLELERGMELRAFVEPSTSRVVRSETVCGPAEQRITFASNYSDFRVVSGVLFAFAEENFAGAMATGLTKLEKIELLPALPLETWSELQ